MSRSFSHWTPRYFVNRILEEIYQKLHPHHPWLTKNANDFLACWLKTTDVGMEFGSGRSTIWFAERVKTLHSVEHDPHWFKQVSALLVSRGFANVAYHLHKQDKSEPSAKYSNYLKILHDVPDHTFDFVLVDGIYRDYCALESLSKIKPGGALIIDNANWYLPCNTYSPNSRTQKQGPKGEIWRQVSEGLRTWRRFWTSSGVTDTALFFKPIDSH
jgi:predicted O-methyltransferase YrrM